MNTWKRALLAGLAAGCLLPVAASAQVPARIEVNHASLQMNVGDTVQLSATAYDASGNEIEAPIMFFSSSRRRLDVDRQTGRAVAVKGGDFTVRVFALTARQVQATVDVSVAYPPVTEVRMSPRGDRFFVGAAVRHHAEVYDASGDHRKDMRVRWTTDDPSVASVNRFGEMEAHRAGTVTLTASAEGVTASHTYRVVDNPIRTVTLAASMDSARTGDVVHFTGHRSRRQRAAD